MTNLRSDYENLVRALGERALSLRQTGASEEAIARTLHAERRMLAAKFKELTPEPQRSRIRARTLATYADPIGPSIERLRDAGKSWSDIIAGAARPGPEVK